MLLFESDSLTVYIYDAHVQTRVSTFRTTISYFIRSNLKFLLVARVEFGGVPQTAFFPIPPIFPGAPESPLVGELHQRLSVILHLRRNFGYFGEIVGDKHRLYEQRVPSVPSSTKDLALMLPDQLARAEQPGARGATAQVYIGANN